jgi:hypothetical protein
VKFAATTTTTRTRSKYDLKKNNTCVTAVVLFLAGVFAGLAFRVGRRKKLAKKRTFLLLSVFASNHFLNKNGDDPLQHHYSKTEILNSRTTTRIFSTLLVF